MPDIMSFEDALEESSGQDRNLLLGNGFSIAWKPEVFSYRSLKEKALSLDQTTQDVFAALETVDFEKVIDAYEYAAKVCSVYEMECDFARKAESVRRILVETIAENHPSMPSEISDQQYTNCISFLSNFRKDIYILNYDLLLYWVLMHDRFKEDGGRRLSHYSDGFAYNGEEFLNWDGTNFNLHFMHGALHLFEKSEFLKLNYSNTQVRLKDQFIDLIMNRKTMPLFVAEGSSNNKMNRIRSSGYLTRCYNSLQKIGGSRNPQSFFTYGVSFSENDSHIIECLGKNKCQNYYIGIYGDFTDHHNENFLTNVRKISHVRSMQRNPASLSIKFYNASSANVWR